MSLTTCIQPRLIATTIAEMLAFITAPDGTECYCHQDNILYSWDINLNSWISPIKQVELDFGSVPIKMKKFTINDASILSSHKITATLFYDNPSDGETDSAEWFENILLMARAGTGQLFIFASSLFVDLNGKVKINYIKG